MPAGLVGPHSRDDVIDRIDQALGAVGANLTVRALRRIAANRRRVVEQEMQPSMRELPCVQIPPRYAPLPKAHCTMLVMRASPNRGSWASR
jgi:hypothetical protein